MGIKNIPFQIEYLSAGHFPESLIPKLKAKTVPVLEVESSEAETPIIMQESLEIIEFLDRSIVQPLFKHYDVNSEVISIVKEISVLTAALCYPRMPFLGLPELQDSQAQCYFQQSREKRINMSFSDALRNTNEIVNACEPTLRTLVSEYPFNELVNEVRDINIDDVAVFSELRNLTMIKELQLPKVLLAYIELVARKAEIKLFHPINKLGQVD